MKNMKKKTILMLATMVLLLTVTVGSTIAYLVTSSGPVENKFTPSYVTSKVNEKFNQTTKEKVKIQNTGNTSAYIRAAIVITWKDAEGNNTLPDQPGTGDYSMTLGDGWTEGSDGFYYWKDKVASGAETGVLITECKQTKQYEDGRRLCVEIIGSAIQSEGGAVTVGADGGWTIANPTTSSY